MRNTEGRQIVWIFSLLLAGCVGGPAQTGDADFNEVAVVDEFRQNFSAQPIDGYQHHGSISHGDLQAIEAARAYLERAGADIGGGYVYTVGRDERHVFVWVTYAASQTLIEVQHSVFPEYEVVLDVESLEIVSPR